MTASPSDRSQAPGPPPDGQQSVLGALMAVPPELPSFPPRALITILSMLAGGLRAPAVIYAGELGRAAERGHGSEYREFTDAWHRAMAEFRKVLRIGSSR